MYRKQTWTMRQYAGYASAKESNERYKYLLAHGSTGLSMAFDLPTQLGLDSDDPRCLGEVGRTGVAIDTIDDMRTAFDGIPLDEVSTSMTINAPAAVLLLLYQIVGEEQGVEPAKLRGTTQNDILKEYIARGNFIYPPEGAMRLTTDLFAYCKDTSRAGTRSRSPATTSARRAARRSRRSRSRWPTASPTCRRRSTRPQGRRLRPAPGLLLQRPQPRLPGGREVPRRPADVGADHARALRAENPKSMMLRFHTQTGGVTLTAQQPINNIVRVRAAGLRRDERAAPSRCTPTASTRRSRCPPSAPRRSRCAPSRSSRTSPA
jgi:methylmalonyl-CoA mutase N-terminal domain/subunit